jgi:hypothetical protein
MKGDTTVILRETGAWRKRHGGHKRQRPGDPLAARRRHERQRMAQIEAICAGWEAGFAAGLSVVEMRRLGRSGLRLLHGGVA